MFKKIKNNLFYITLSIFLISNIFIVGWDFPFKKIFLLVLLFITIILSFVYKDKAMKIIRYFIYLNNDQTVKKISGGISLFSWFLFICSLFLLNLGFLWLARWCVLLFVVAVIINGILVFYDLWCARDIILKKFKPLFFSGVTVLYFITNTYAASYFLKMSNMDISNSPLLELGWKSAFFSIWFFVFMQPISYCFFLYVSNKFKDHKVMSSVGILLFLSLLSGAVLHWANNLIVLSLDWATSNEWRSHATCGSLDISNKTERYFGFNTDKYTVYFSNRDGQWGFEEIKCIKDDKNQDSLIRVTVSQSAMPKWFKE